jgi:hypothetical protein
MFPRLAKIFIGAIGVSRLWIWIERESINSLFQRQNKKATLMMYDPKQSDCLDMPAAEQAGYRVALNCP